MYRPRWHRESDTATIVTDTSLSGGGGHCDDVVVSWSGAAGEMRDLSEERGEQTKSNFRKPSTTSASVVFG
eukprot:scaffold3356_cov264-Pinguiococcus_pyrenoidosus.AAC.4